MLNKVEALLRDGKVSARLNPYVLKLLGTIEDARGTGPRGKAAKPKGQMGIVPGTCGIVLAMKVPDGKDVEFVDEFLTDHMPWMGKTHR